MAEITKLENGASVSRYAKGRIKVKIPTKLYLSLVASHEGDTVLPVWDFLREHGIKDFNREYFRSYIEQSTGHVCYAYRPAKKKAKPSTVKDMPRSIKSKVEPKLVVPKTAKRKTRRKGKYKI